MSDTVLMSIILTLMVVVSLSDLLYRKIHNHIVVIIFFLSVINWLNLWFSNTQDGSFWGQLGQSLLVTVTVFCLGFGLFLGGQMGAGDVKLMGTLCLFMPPASALTFLIITALCGGLLVVILPLLTMLELRLARIVVWVNQVLPKLNLAQPTILKPNTTKSGLPYGIAIAMGCIYTLNTPFTSFIG